jgi:hypothetical protein
MSAVLVLLTTVSFYVSHIMPDVFTAALVLSLFLLVFASAELSRRERVYLFLLATACICFHLSHLIVASGVTVAVSVLWLVNPARRRQISIAWAGGAVALACCAFVAFSLVVYKRVDFTPKSPPFLMARMIADGPARDYLARVCGQSEMTVCRYAGDFPETENEILWAFLGPMRLHDPDTFWTIKAEQNRVVFGTIMMFPARTAANAITGMARQFFTVDSELFFDSASRAALDTQFPFADSHPPHSLQAKGGFSDGFMGLFNAVDALTDGLAAVICMIFIARTDRRRDWRLIALPWVVTVGLLANSFASGALAGVFGRYQGRLVWLLPFSAAILVLSAMRPRTP